MIVLPAPVERAYSHFVMDRRTGWKSIVDFGAALDSEPDDAVNFWWGAVTVFGMNCMLNIVKQYLQTFPREQINIMFYEDLVWIRYFI
ncbi:MAG: hypothetical protein HOI35_03505 [Woeseia sp.]|nr:hypothetical protein [Woeseia sp.]MBT6209071.1 hypothetical protein [Woeseia sp.]